jgi:hypothetical protein
VATDEGAVVSGEAELGAATVKGAMDARGKAELDVATDEGATAVRTEKELDGAARRRGRRRHGGCSTRVRQTAVVP